MTTATYSSKHTKASHLDQFYYTYEDIKVTGVIGKPVIARSNRSNQLFFVNERYIRDKNLSAADYQSIADTLNEKIDESDINTAGWLPGHDWTGTIYEPIYEACGRNQVLSGMFFGLIVFDLLMRKDDKTWGFGRFEKDGKQIASMTYFVLDNPPAR